MSREPAPTPGDLLARQATAVRDVIAAARAAYAGDDPAMIALMEGSGRPRLAFGMAAMAIAEMIRMNNPPFSTDKVEELLAVLSSRLTNTVLDRYLAQESGSPQQLPGAGDA